MNIYKGRLGYRSWQFKKTQPIIQPYPSL